MPERRTAEDRGPDALPVDPDVNPGSGTNQPSARLRPVLLGSSWDVLLVVGAGGALGSLGRWAVGEALPWSGTGFPWATFVENVTGALALGALMVLLLEVWPPHRYLRPFLGVGVLGGYTTFSTVMLETHDLLRVGQEFTALVYLGASLAVGLLAVWLGMVAARLTVRAARPGPPERSVPQRRARPRPRPERGSTP